MATTRPQAGPASPGPRTRLPAGRRTRWLVVAILAAVFVNVLAVNAYVDAKFAPDPTHHVGGQDRVPADVVNGGPIIDLSDGRPRSYRLPSRTIALTFDDGPDPTWTPQILGVLSRHQVKGTFFVLGSQVARHPDLARQMAKEGHEIGAHSFTHPDLTGLDGWRRRLEYAQTQLAIAKAAGVQTALMRFPYSSRSEAIDNLDWPLVREAGRLGYLVVVNDIDSQDWTRPGVDAIVRNMTPATDAGAVILLHDAGGDRSQTVAALDRFIPAMLAKGYQFTTVTDGLGRALANAGESGAPIANPPASALDRWWGASLIWAIRIAGSILTVLAVLFIVVGLLTLARTSLLLALAGRHARRRRSPTWSWGPPVTEPVTVIVPAYNEKEGIAATIRSLASSDHPRVEVIVVDDGSTDGTADIVEALGLPDVRVIRKANGGKASALNTGLALAGHQLVVTVDGDTVFETDAIRHLVQPFADPSVGAVAGNVKVGNRSSLLAAWQHIEYVIGFNLDRRLYETLRCMPTVPGAIAAFRRRAVLAVGGMSDDTLAEDTDVTMAVSRAGWQVVYEEKARAWTEAPATWPQLWRQRYRWSYGTMQAMWKHRHALLDEGPSGRFGRRGLSLLAVFGVALPLLAPLVDVMTLYGFFFLDRGATVGAWLAMLGLQTLTAVVAFRLDRESLRPLWVLPLQQFAYRQLMYLVLIRSIRTALVGARLRWQKLQRTGEALASRRPAGTEGAGPPADVSGRHLVEPGGAGRPVEPGGAGRPVEPASTPAESVATGAPRRDRWFDTLRAIALARVFLYHMFPVAWLSFAFPAMGVMFAVAGSLMARSVDRSPARAVASRVRRLLPALWVMGAVLVPVMLLVGWPDRPAWPRLLTWIVPAASPPGSDWARPVTEVLWYLVTYLWLVLLTPAALRLYRRRPALTVLLPLGVLAVLETTPPLLGSTVDAVATDVATFGACWVVGFAHRDGALRRLALPALLALAALSIGAGTVWAVTHPGLHGLDLNGIPLAQACYSLGFVLLLLRARPRLAWLARAPVLGRLVAVLNARAVTVYLWHNLAIAGCFVVGDAVGVWRLGNAGYLLVAASGVLAIVLALGWVEDLGARRRPRLLPWPADPIRQASPVRPPAGPVRRRLRRAAGPTSAAAPARSPR